MNLGEMFTHSIFQTSESETTSDSSDDQLEQDVEWEFCKIKFIERVYNEIEGTKILP